MRTNFLGTKYLGKRQRAVLDWLREHKYGTEAQIGEALYAAGISSWRLEELQETVFALERAAEDWARTKLLSLKNRGLVRKMDPHQRSKLVGLSPFDSVKDLWGLDPIGHP